MIYCFGETIRIRTDPVWAVCIHIRSLCKSRHGRNEIQMKILVTGGTGFIGSHTSVLLLQSGHDVVIADNLVNSKPTVIDSIEKITNRRPKFYECDLTDEAICEQIFSENDFDSVIHFAGLKAVGESVSIPLEYYKNNLLSTLNVLMSMRRHGCKSFIFSSSATVYGNPHALPITEDFPLSYTNPYGGTKYTIENILRDLAVADSSLSLTILRYFNPIGAHESGLIGEDPNGIPNNLMPLIMKAANGEMTLRVFGNDYNTPDGTGVRDYIHVMDLADGHIKALSDYDKPGVHTYNLGTGHGYSVLEIINAFEKVNGVKVPYTICERRPGDIDACYADPTKAKNEIGFIAKHGIDDMCRDAWHYYKMQKGSVR